MSPGVAPFAFNKSLLLLNSEAGGCSESPSDARGNHSEPAATKFGQSIRRPVLRYGLSTTGNECGDFARDTCLRRLPAETERSRKENRADGGYETFHQPNYCEPKGSARVTTGYFGDVVVTGVIRLFITCIGQQRP